MPSQVVPVLAYRCVDLFSFWGIIGSEQDGFIRYYFGKIKDMISCIITKISLIVGDSWGDALSEFHSAYVWPGPLPLTSLLVQTQISPPSPSEQNVFLCTYWLLHNARMQLACQQGSIRALACSPLLTDSHNGREAWHGAPLRVQDILPYGVDVGGVTQECERPYGSAVWGWNTSAFFFFFLDK